MGFCLGRLCNFDGDLLNAQNILREACNFVGMEHEWRVFVVTDFGVKTFGVEGWIEIGWVGVSVAVDGRSRTIENFLNGFYGDELFGRVNGDAVGGNGNSTFLANVCHRSHFLPVSI